MMTLYKVPVVKWSARIDSGEERYVRTYNFGTDFKINTGFTKRRLMDKGFSRRYADKLQLSEVEIDGKRYRSWKYEGQPAVYVAEDGFYVDEEVDIVATATGDELELAKRLHHVYRCFSVLRSTGFVDL